MYFHAHSTSVPGKILSTQSQASWSSKKFNCHPSFAFISTHDFVSSLSRSFDLSVWCIVLYEIMDGGPTRRGLSGVGRKLER
jgi:hypothetical protein